MRDRRSHEVKIQVAQHRGRHGSHHSPRQSERADKHDIKIVCTYGMQKQMYYDALFRLSSKLNIKKKNLPVVIGIPAFTATSMQGREASFIIHDPSLSFINTKGDFGMSRDERLMNVSFNKSTQGPPCTL